MRSNLVGVFIAGFCAGSPLVGALAGMGCEGRSTRASEAPSATPATSPIAEAESEAPLAGGAYAPLSSNSYGAYSRAANAPKLGERAPDFTLPNQRGESVRLSDIAARAPVVLVFYRGDW